MAHYIKIIHPDVLVLNRNHGIAVGTRTGQSNYQARMWIQLAASRSSVAYWLIQLGPEDWTALGSFASLPLLPCLSKLRD